MTEVSKNVTNIFLAKIHPILKVEVGLFSKKKRFVEKLPNTTNLFLYLIMSEVSEKSKTKKLLLFTYNS